MSEAPARQLALPIRAPATGWAAIIETPANRLVLERLRRTGPDSASVLALIGPAKSGKTAIGRTWAFEVGGLAVDATDLDRAAPAVIDDLAGRPVFVDDADQTEAGDNLWMLMARQASAGAPVVLAGRRGNGVWTAQRPDLVSRFRSAVRIDIDRPDDQTLADLVVGLCAARYMRAPRAVADYLVRHVPRDYGTIAQVFEGLEDAVVGHGRALSVATAREVVERLGVEG